MKKKKLEYIISITISGFGNLAKFYKTYSKGNRVIEVENVEHENTKDQHNTGIMIESIICSKEKLHTKVTKFVDKNYLRGECFSVREKGKKKVIMTEEDFPRY